MLVREMYVCGVCGSAFTNQREAERCENSHTGLANNILVQEFHKDYEYPLYLTVVTDDGGEVRYKYIGVEE